MCERDHSWSIVNGYLKVGKQQSWPVLKSDCDGAYKPENVAFVARYRWIGDSKPVFTGNMRDPRWHQEII